MTGEIAEKGPGMLTRHRSAPTAPIRIGIVAGEASGDTLGATLIRAVRATLPNAEFVGIGGPQMQSAGCIAWYPSSKLSLRGYVEVLRHLPSLIRLRRSLFKRFREAQISLFIGIDAPDFNLGIEARLKAAGVRTMHYVSPSVWAWRRERLARIKRSVHRMLVLFPFEPVLYQQAQIPVNFVGHPLARHRNTYGTRKEMRLKLKIAEGTGPVIALLPGSRMSELAMHAELLLKVAAEMVKAHPNAVFLVPLVSRETRIFFENTQYRLGLEHLPLTILYGHADHALLAADAGLVASGTATLEAAICGCPHVVFYRVNALTAFIVQRKLLQAWVALPNILAGRFIVPELLQDDATVENLSQALGNLLEDAVVRERQENILAGLAETLVADSTALVRDAVLGELESARPHSLSLTSWPAIRS